MSNLIKTDFYSLIKDKTFIIAIIISTVLAFFGVISNYLLYTLINIESSLSGDQFIYAAMNIAGDMGLLIPIMIGIIISRDFKSGTIRNKVILGYSRKEIFFSRLIVMLCFGLGIYFIYFFSNVILSAAMSGMNLFPFSSTGSLSANDFLTLLVRFLLSIIQFSLLVVFITFMGFLSKKLIGPLLSGIGLYFLSSIILSVTSVVSFLGFLSGGIEFQIEEPWLLILNLIPAYQGAVITDYSGSLSTSGLVPDYSMIAFFASNAVYLGLFIFLGYISCKKADYK